MKKIALLCLLPGHLNGMQSTRAIPWQERLQDLTLTITDHRNNPTYFSLLPKELRLLIYKITKIDLVTKDLGQMVEDQEKNNFIIWFQKAIVNHIPLIVSINFDRQFSFNQSSLIYQLIKTKQSFILEHFLKNKAYVARQEMIDHTKKGTVIGSALHLAVKEKNYRAAELLLSHGLPVDQKDNWGETPLCYAVENGYVNLVNLLLHYRANPNNINRNGFTLLHTSLNNNDVCQLLCVYQAHINQISGIGTALCWAASQDLEEAARILLRHGADPNIGCTPYGYEHKYDNEKSIDNMCPLHMACSKNMVNLLIKFGANVNQQTIHGVTPLHHFVQYRPEVVESLLEFKPHLSLCDWKGKTPLDYARDLKNDELIALLEKAGEI